MHALLTNSAAACPLPQLTQIPLTYMMSELTAIADEIDTNGTNITDAGECGACSYECCWFAIVQQSMVKPCMGFVCLKYFMHAPPVT